MSRHCDRELEAQLVRAARAALPREACGLLLGRREPRGVRFLAAREARNLASRRDRFRVHPADHLAAEREARSRGLEVLGAWHSHPRGSAAPSPEDRSGSPEGWWLAIVGLGAPGAPEVRWVPPRSTTAV